MDGTRFEFEGEDGITLVAEAWGDPAHPAVILAHGGGQTRHSWGGTAQALAAQGWYAVAYDHRGHGESDWSADSLYEMAHFALDMACLARSFDKPPAVVGASLGGMAAMMGAGEIQADMFSCIVLVDVTPRVNLAGVMRIFEFMHSHIETGFASLEEAAEAIATYTGRPKRGDLSGLRKNLRERDGRSYWHGDPNFFAPRKDGLNQPERLLEVPKFPRKGLEKMRASWREHKAIRDIMVFLHAQGISQAYGEKIFRTYSFTAAEVIRENPYRLAMDVQGIGFRIADGIARRLGVAPDAPERAEAGVLYVLEELTGEGHTAYPRAKLARRAAKILDIPEPAVEEAVETLLRDGLLKAAEESAEGEPFLARPRMVRAEEAIAKHLARIRRGEPSAKVKKKIE